MNSDRAHIEDANGQCSPRSCDESSPESSASVLLLSVDDLGDESLNDIYNDMFHYLYVSDNWSPSFYVLQAFHGFIAVSYQDVYILPEIQREYCTLDWKDMKVTSSFKKKLRRELKCYDVKMTYNTATSAVIKGIQSSHSSDCWLKTRYANLCEYLSRQGSISIGGSEFKLLSVELWRRKKTSDSWKLVAGELGYAIGSVYTSLTGYSIKTDSFSLGTLQLLLLGKSLEGCGFTFWNLGHPPRGSLMKYKADLGGRIFSRLEFLKRWMSARIDHQAVDNLLTSLDCIPSLSHSTC